MRKRTLRLMVVLTFVLILVLTMLPATAFARDELKNTDPDRFYIVLDTKNQIVFVYERDENGEYTRLVRCFICSSGMMEPRDPEDPEDMGSPTPTGIWKIGTRERFGKFAAFGEYARYWTQIVGGNYFHSIMFGDRDVTKLKSGAYGQLGKAVSHGCVRLYVEDAKWLYYYACPGTTIEVTNASTGRHGDLKKALKSRMPFKEYKALQENFYDEPELENNKAWVVYDGAPLRTGNGSNDSVRARVPAGAEVEVLQDGDPWVKVRYENKEGYMLLAYVTYEQGVMQSKEDADIIKATNWVFSEMDNDKEYRICKVPTSTSVKVLERTEDWVKIEYSGEVGFMPARSVVKGWGTIRE